ncbi:hypothetical protein [Lapidilactobacillus gannanensis]|uniref:Surface layer protein A domain-containing protein n=2 Tax=Lapidilactobacillus gannanensis TaxID=2486002 RepID=A0ABW4BPC6_9LACO
MNSHLKKFLSLMIISIFFLLTGLNESNSVVKAAKEVTDGNVTIVYPDQESEQLKITELVDDNVTVVYLESANAKTTSNQQAMTTTYPGNGHAYVNESLPSTPLPLKNYRQILEPIQVTPDYEAVISFYCLTSEGNNFRAIKKIVYIDVMQLNGTKFKQFNGHIYAHLSDANQLHYFIDGDFYNSNENGRTIPETGQVLDKDSLLTNFTAEGINPASKNNYIFQEGQVNF